MENNITLQCVGELTITTIPQHHTKKPKEQISRRLERLRWFLTKYAEKDGKIHIDEVMKYASMAENLEMYKELDRELNRPSQFHVLFKQEDAYAKVMDLLFENKWIDLNGHWILPGSGKKTIFIWLLRLLEHRNYFNNKLDANTIIHIALNSFQLELSPDLVTGIKATSQHLQQFPFLEAL